MQVHEPDQFIKLFREHFDADTELVMVDAVRDMLPDSEDFRLIILEAICHRSDCVGTPIVGMLPITASDRQDGHCGGPRKVDHGLR